MLRKRDTLPGRAWRCFVKIHPFPHFAPKREPPGVPGGGTGDALGVSLTGSRVRVLPWQYHGVPLARKFYLERR